MAVRKNTKAQAQTILPEVSTGSDLSLRLDKISEQTGLSPQNLLQKWILQEETMIGLMRSNKEPVAEPQPKSTNAALPKKPAARKKAPETVPLDPNSPDYLRKILIQRVEELKSEGMSLKKIAEALNKEKAPTVSGSGKWYGSSVTNLLKSKK